MCLCLMYLLLDKRHNMVLYSDTFSLSHCAADRWHLCQIYHLLRQLLPPKYRQKGIFYSVIPPVAPTSCDLYLLLPLHIIRYFYTKYSQLGAKYDIWQAERMRKSTPQVPHIHKYKHGTLPLVFYSFWERRGGSTLPMGEYRRVMKPHIHVHRVMQDQGGSNQATEHFQWSENDESCFISLRGITSGVEACKKRCVCMYAMHVCMYMTPMRSQKRRDKKGLKNKARTHRVCCRLFPGYLTSSCILADSLMRKKGCNLQMEKWRWQSDRKVAYGRMRRRAFRKEKCIVDLHLTCNAGWRHWWWWEGFVFGDRGWLTTMMVVFFFPVSHHETHPLSGTAAPEE